MPDFAFDDENIALPRGAWAKTHRRRLIHAGRPVLALTQGAFRPYVFPLCTPAGFAVTSECPADHPHHASLWIASDHVHMLMPAAGDTVEEYTYNFYVDEVFQGRAPGRVVETAVSGRPIGEDAFEIAQELEWRGPSEWAAREGRLVAREIRTLRVATGPTRHRIDLASHFTSGEHALKLGPTRHAWFNARVADSMIVANGGAIRDDRGRHGGTGTSGEGARWVDFSGPVGGGATAGLSIIPRFADGRTSHWFVADWGVITVGPFRSEALRLEPGETFAARCTVLVHDGEADVEEIERIADEES